MDERIEAFLRDVLLLEGEDSNVIRESVRQHLAVYEKQFRDHEPAGCRTDQAVQRCRMLCRERVVQEIARAKGPPTKAHLEIVLSVIDSPARAPLPPAA